MNGCHHGAIVPSRVEFTDDMFQRRPDRRGPVRSVRDLSSDFRNHFKDNENAWKSVETIASLIAENRLIRWCGYYFV